MDRLATLFAALIALIALQGCLAATAVGAAAGATIGVAGATIGVAGDVAEGAVKIVTPGGDDDDEDEDGERRD
jgi:uncharacterized OsmC-like protein